MMTTEEALYWKGYIDNEIARKLATMNANQTDALRISRFANSYMQLITGQQFLPQGIFREFLEMFENIPALQGNIQEMQEKLDESIRNLQNAESEISDKADNINNIKHIYYPASAAQPTPASITVYFDALDETKTLYLAKAEGWYEEGAPDLFYQADPATVGSGVFYNNMQVGTITSYTAATEGASNASSNPFYHYYDMNWIEERTGSEAGSLEEDDIINLFYSELNSYSGEMHIVVFDFPHRGLQSCTYILLKRTTQTTPGFVTGGRRIGGMVLLSFDGYYTYSSAIVGHGSLSVNNTWHPFAMETDTQEEREVVVVESYEALSEIGVDDRTSRAIYRTTDEDRLYLWNGEEFVRVDGQSVDNIIYVTDLDDIIEKELTKGVYNVIYSYIDGRKYHTKYYTLIANGYVIRAVGNTQKSVLNLILSNVDGWAEVVSDEDDNLSWKWHIYSYDDDVQSAISRLKVQGQRVDSNKEVIEVATEEALVSIANPTNEVIYITSDEHKLFIYEDGEFVEVTNRSVAETLYVNDLDSIIPMSLANGVQQVCLTQTTDGGYTTDYYTLSVTTVVSQIAGESVSSTRLVLANINGWAEVVDGAWKWHHYAYSEAPDHSIEDDPSLQKLVLTIGNDQYLINREKLEKPVTPTLTAGGTFTGSKSVSISSATSGVTIRYTTNGSTPTASNGTVGTSLTLSQDTSVEERPYTVKAVAIKNGLVSDVATATYIIKRQVAKPVITADGTIYDLTRRVNITCATTGAQIYMTGDGSTPSASSTHQNSTVLSDSATIKAIGILADWANSEVASNAVVVGTKFTHAGGSNKASGLTEADVLALTNEKKASSPAGAYTIVLASASYIWFCVPQGQNINGIVSGVVQVPYESPVTVGSYKCYRLTNQINAGTHEFTIS